MVSWCFQVIAAEGEKKASRCIKEAADVLTESPASIQLRYLQTLHSISEEQNHTVVLPLPNSLLSGLGIKGGPQLSITPPGQQATPHQRPSTTPTDDQQDTSSAEQQQLIDLDAGNTQF